MNQIVDYRMVLEDKPKEFEFSVMQMIDEGWKLFGHPFLAGTEFCQAMIKLEETSETTPL